MKKIPTSAFKIANLPSGASLVDVFKQINPNINSDADIQTYTKSTQTKIVARTKTNKAKKKARITEKKK